MLEMQEPGMSEALKRKREGLAVVIAVKPIEELSPEEREKYDKESGLAPNPSDEEAEAIEPEAAAEAMPAEMGPEMEGPPVSGGDQKPRSLFERAMKAQATKRKGMPIGNSRP